MGAERWMRAAVLALGCVLATTIAQAQQAAYPSRPLRLILPFPPGGSTDLLGRALADKLGESLRQPVVPENRPGAGGNVGAEAAARSAPDGYTLVLCAPSLAISPSLYRKLNYDPLRDLVPVALVANIPNLLVVHPSVPARTLAELAQHARANPGKLNFGTGGPGTSNQLAADMFRSLTKDRDRAGAVQGRGDRDARGAVGAGADGRDRPAGVDAAPEERQAARARAAREGALPGPAGGADRGGVGHARVRGRHLVRRPRAGRRAAGDRGAAERRISRRSRARRTRASGSRRWGFSRSRARRRSSASS